jgi:hypothetical protein
LFSDKCSRARISGPPRAVKPADRPQKRPFTILAQYHILLDMRKIVKPILMLSMEKHAFSSNMAASQIKKGCEDSQPF